MSASTELPEWVGKFLNRRGAVEEALRVPLQAIKKGLPAPGPMTPEALNDLADKLAVPDEFMPAGKPISVEQEVALLREVLKATGHEHEGRPLDILVDRAIDRERGRIEEIRTAVAALEAVAQRVYKLPDYMLEEIRNAQPE